MTKKIIVIIIIAGFLIVGLAITGYFYLSWIKKPKANGLNTAEDITNSATKGVLPSLQTNPLENKPDVNPADKTNPFANIKTNPF